MLTSMAINQMVMTGPLLVSSANGLSESFWRDLNAGRSDMVWSKFSSRYGILYTPLKFVFTHVSIYLKGFHPFVFSFKRANALGVFFIVDILHM